MTSLIWIDLDEAAGWLSSRPDDVMCLIREGAIGTQHRPHENIVVRADDVRRLAEFWTVKKPKRPRACFKKRPATRCKLA